MALSRLDHFWVGSLLVVAVQLLLVLALGSLAGSTEAFQLVRFPCDGSALRMLRQHQQPDRRPVALRLLQRRAMADDSATETPSTADSSPSMDSMMLDELDDETRRQLEKIRRSDELRAQEVFMTKATGRHRCTNCDWVYDEAKGDVVMIGGTIPAGTPFAELPDNWRCPVCRASKDSFSEVVEEIPGFAVNQGYGFGTNSWTSSQKNLAIFGGLAFFFLLFLSGYALS
jgi:rubredoxin